MAIGYLGDLAACGSQKICILIVTLTLLMLRREPLLGDRRDNILTFWVWSHHQFLILCYEQPYTSFPWLLVPDGPRSDRDQERTLHWGQCHTVSHSVTQCHTIWQSVTQCETTLAEAQSLLQTKSIWWQRSMSSPKVLNDGDWRPAFEGIDGQGLNSSSYFHTNNIA